MDVSTFGRGRLVWYAKGSGVRGEKRACVSRYVSRDANQEVRATEKGELTRSRPSKRGRHVWIRDLL